MNIAYLILAHDHPAHLKRLITALASSRSWFYVHLDRKADARQFADVWSDRVAICATRIDCAWGDISLVDATLELARTALAGPACSYHVLLSGACYPVQPVDYIHRWFERNAGRECIEAFPFPNDFFGKPTTRIERYFIKRNKPFYRTKSAVQKFLQFVLPPRDYGVPLQGLTLVTGSQWWALTEAALRYVVDRLEKEPNFYAFCRHIDCPDEFVFQVMLWNSPFRNAVAHSLTYTRWKPGDAGPSAIDAGDLERFQALRILDSPQNNCPNEKGEVLFARKFTDRSAELLAVLDRSIRRKQAVASTADAP